jgi:hypothetical protein
MRVGPAGVDRGAMGPDAPPVGLSLTGDALAVPPAKPDARAVTEMARAIVAAMAAARDAGKGIGSSWSDEAKEHGAILAP